MLLIFKDLEFIIKKNIKKIYPILFLKKMIFPISFKKKISNLTFVIYLFLYKKKSLYNFEIK